MFVWVIGFGGSMVKVNNFILFKVCDYCGWDEWMILFNGIYVDENEWDGSDFFWGVEYYLIFMIECVVCVFE